MSVTIPSLDPVTDILDTDKIMVTQSSGQTYTIDGASFNKRNQAVIANSTTLTGAPLKTSNIVRAYFTADITGVNTTTGLVLNYNGSNKNVKVPKNGALVNFTAQNMGGTPTVYKYLQAYTTLELLYDGTNFVIIGNPVVLSSSTYLYYADGTHNVNSVTSGNMQSVSSNAVANILNISQDDSTIIDITSSLTRYLGIGTVIARRKHNIVYLSIYGSYTGGKTTVTQTLIEDLPTKYRPFHDMEGFALLGYNSNQYVICGRAKIDSAGNIYLQETSWEQGTQIRADLIYFVN